MRESRDEQEEPRKLAWFAGTCPMQDDIYPEECCDEPDECREIAERLKASDSGATATEGIPAPGVEPGEAHPEASCLHTEMGGRRRRVRTDVT